jgi:hypothetical protein
MSALHTDSTSIYGSSRRANRGEDISARGAGMTEELCFKSKVPYPLHSMMARHRGDQWCEEQEKGCSSAGAE